MDPLATELTVLVQPEEVINVILQSLPVLLNVEAGGSSKVVAVDSTIVATVVGPPETQLTVLNVGPAGSELSIAGTGYVHFTGGIPDPIAMAPTCADVGADPLGAAAAITLLSLGGIPTSRQIAGHALSSDVTLSKSDVGLTNVDNTSDANKPVSLAQATALGLKLNQNDVSVTNARQPTAHKTTHAIGGADALTYADVGADAAGSAVAAAAAVTLTGLGGVPTARTVAGHALTGNVTITAADVGADAAGSAVTAAASITLAGLGGIPNTRTVNSKPLSSNISLSASDVGADVAGAAAAITLAGLGGVPTTRQIAGHALSADITLSKGDVGLSNIDNTSDANKPISSAQATALGLKEATANKGAASGYAPLDSSSLVPVANLPTGTSVAKGALQLGTTAGTAYDGAAGAAATTTANAAIPTTQKGSASGVASLDSATKIPIGQLPTGTTSSTVALGNDSRLADARTPTAHAASHTIGADQISDATGSTHGLESAADKSKLDGIATGATVGADWNSNVTNKPILGTAAAKDIPVTGDASATQVVYGSDSRLANARLPTGGPYATAASVSNVTNDAQTKASIVPNTVPSMGQIMIGNGTSYILTIPTTSNVPDTVDNRYCTDAQKVVISNTSGINSGNETATTIKTALGVTTLSGSNTGDETATTIKTALGIVTLSGLNTGDETASSIESTLGVSSDNVVGLSNLLGRNTGDQSLAGLVPNTLTVNGKALSQNITLTMQDYFPDCGVLLA